MQQQLHCVAQPAVEGVVTLEDVLESLLGSEIVDEHDEVPDMQVLARENAQRAAAEREAGALEGEA